MRKQLIMAATVLCLTAATLSGGAAAADEEGGPGHPTGDVRACQVHAENRGNSYAKGLDCPTLTIMIGAARPCSYFTHVTGTGLEPGSLVFRSLNGGEPIPVTAVGPEGTLSFAAFAPLGSTVTFFATSASGKTITATATIPFPSACQRQ